MEQISYPKTMINSLLFEIKTYPYLRALENQKFLLSFLNYENISLYGEILQFVQNENWYKNELTKSDKKIVKLQVCNLKKEKIIAKLNAKICENSTALDKRLATNNCQILDQIENLFGGLSNTVITSNELLTKTNKSLYKTILKLQKKNKSNQKKYKNKIQILTENISDLKFSKSNLNEHCDRLIQENEILKKHCEIAENEKNELVRLRNENAEIENLCDSLRKSNTKLKLDNNNLHKAIMELKIDLNDSRLDVEYFQDDLEDMANTKTSLAESNEMLKNTIIDLIMQNEKSELDIKARDNDIKWYHEEYTRAKHNLIKLNNVIDDLKQSLANEIKSKSSYQNEFGAINSSLTKKEIEVSELRKQLKLLERENLKNRTAFLISESVSTELRNKLKNSKPITIAKLPKNEIVVEKCPSSNIESDVEDHDWAIY